MPKDWSSIEINLIIKDYFGMLVDELNNRPFNKTDHRKKLIQQLNNRSEGSIEFKHQNISAVLNNLGKPSIKGYLPRNNYQRSLGKEIVQYIFANPWLEVEFEKFAMEKFIHTPLPLDFSNILDTPPVPGKFREPLPAYTKSPFKVNWIQKEQENQSLGLYGEQFVMEFEKWDLITQGKEKLAEQVRWISKEEGDGAGFDILSRNYNGTDKYIEVKTTKLGKETPFYFTKNELEFSKQKAANYHLYRLFNATQHLKIFKKTGSFLEMCNHMPVLYKGFF
jgi:hypothetical protein